MKQLADFEVVEFEAFAAQSSAALTSHVARSRYNINRLYPELFTEEDLTEDVKLQQRYAKAIYKIAREKYAQYVKN